jgi:hypothetical protein
MPASVPGHHAKVEHPVEYRKEAKFPLLGAAAATI